MPEEQVRTGGRYIVDKPDGAPKRVKPLMDASKPPSEANHDPAHHDYPASAGKPKGEAVKEKDKA